MHSAGLELTKLTYTGLEDNLIRHRGDRLYRLPGMLRGYLIQVITPKSITILLRLHRNRLARSRRRLLTTTAVPFSCSTYE